MSDISQIAHNTPVGHYEKKEHFESIQQEPKLVFDNVYGELDFYKKKCDVLEKDLFKSQTTIKKLEISNKKFQDSNALNGKNINNTSISFLLPSEFKTLWENIGKDLILEAYDSLYDDFKTLAYVAHDTLSIVYEETNLFMRDKVKAVLGVLNVNIDLKSNEHEKFLGRFKAIFQDYFSQIFTYTDEFSNKVKFKLLSQTKAYEAFKLDDNKFTDLLADLEKKPFRNLIENLFKLCIYMILHDPVLNINKNTNQEEGERKLSYLYYNKNELMNIEGFGTDQTPCVVIIPSPLLRKNFAYMGIKPAVYCIQKMHVDVQILQECDKNKLREISGCIKKSTSSKDIREMKEGFYSVPVQIQIQIPKMGENKNLVFAERSEETNRTKIITTSKVIIGNTSLTTPVKNVTAISAIERKKEYISAMKLKNRMSEDFNNINNKELKEKEKNMNLNIKLNNIHTNTQMHTDAPSHNNKNNTDALAFAHSNQNNNCSNNPNNNNLHIKKIGVPIEDLSDRKNKIKKCYDIPLIMKVIKSNIPSAEVEETACIFHFGDKRPHTGSFMSTSKKNEIDSSLLHNNYKTALNIQVKTSSRSSSIGDPSENKERKVLVSPLHLQNLNNNTNVLNTLNVNSNNNNNNSGTPLNSLRFIPTNGEKGFTVIRSKNSKQVYISDNIKRGGLMNNSLIDKFNNENTNNNNTNYSFKEADVKGQNIINDFIRYNNNNKEVTPSKEAEGGNKMNNAAYASSFEPAIEEKRKGVNAYVQNHNGPTLFTNLNNLNRIKDGRENIKEMVKDYKEIKDKGNLIMASIGNLLNSNLNKTAVKEKKLESRMFANTPNRNTKALEPSFTENLKTEEFFNYIDSKGKDLIKEHILTDDMKFNGLKKDNFGVRKSQNEYTSHPHPQSTPLNNKINPKMDIKSRVGKIYTEVLNIQANVTDSNNGNNNTNTKNYFNQTLNNTNMNLVSNSDYQNNSPKSIHTYSTLPEKNFKEVKDKRLLILANTNKVKLGTYYSNIQNKGIKK